MSEQSYYEMKLLNETDNSEEYDFVLVYNQDDLSLKHKIYVENYLNNLEINGLFKKEVHVRLTFE